MQGNHLPIPHSSTVNMKQSILASLILLSYGAQAQVTAGTDLPILKDYAAMVQFSRSNPDTILAPFDAGLAVFQADLPIALAGAEVVAQLLPEVQRMQQEGSAPDTTSTGIPARRNVLEKRACSRPGCYNTAVCYQYSDCHVCLGTGAGMHRRGYCI
jgi:hypothetical protein